VADLARRAVLAAFLYFAVIFAAGFGLGAVRVLVTAPRLGELGGVLLELPVILSISWVVCGRSVRGFGLAGHPGAALAMGALAFAMLMIAELVLAVALFGRTPAEHYAAYRQPAGLIGLAGQIAFGLTPALRGGSR
jgi:hypothetical protein